MILTTTNFGSRKSFHHHPVSSDHVHVTQVRLAGRRSRPTRPKSNPLVKSLDAWMMAWVMRVASSCFDSLIRCSALELCPFPPMDGAVRWMTSWLSMDEPLRSGNRPKPQHWKSDESTEVEETSAEEDLRRRHCEDALHDLSTRTSTT